MNDYELLYYIYQNDDEALQLLMEKYEKTIYFTVKKTVEKYAYVCEISDELDEMRQLSMLEFYHAIYRYCDDGRCSFSVFAQKCMEMCIRKYIRSRRSQANSSMSKALRLDSKVKEEEGIYYVDTFPNINHEFEGDALMKWYHEKNLLAYLRSELRDDEFMIVRMKLEGYNQREIGQIMAVNNKRVSYVCKKMQKLLLSYID